MDKKIFEQLYVQIGALAFADARLQSLCVRAQRALEESRLDDVQVSLKELAQGALPEMIADGGQNAIAAGLQAALGWAAMLEAEYRRAAGHFREAQSALPPKERGRRHDYRLAEANAHFREGRKCAHDEALHNAVALLGALLRQTRRQRTPKRWRLLQNELGNVWLTLAERERGTGSLKKALAAFRSASDDDMRARDPVGWAMMQSKVGIALTRLGECEGNTARLAEAIGTLRAALAHCSRERMPLGWALTQNYLGMALFQLGRQQTGTISLREAILAFRAALEERTRQRVPLSWARTQHNLGVALFTLAERENSADRLEEAAAAFCCALQERTPARGLKDWATTHTSMGNVLSSLGMHEGGKTRLVEAIGMYREAIATLEGANAPGLIAEVRACMSNACQMLARHSEMWGKPSSIH